MMTNDIDSDTKTIFGDYIELIDYNTNYDKFESKIHFKD